MNVKVKALRSFRYKGKTIEKGEELMMATHGAATYSNIGYVSVSDKEKVEKAVDQKEKVEGSPVTAKKKK